MLKHHFQFHHSHDQKDDIVKIPQKGVSKTAREGDMRLDPSFYAANNLLQMIQSLAANICMQKY